MKRKLRGIDRALPIALLRAREATMRKFKPYVDSTDLTMQQWRVIRVLGENDTQLASEISEKCVIMPSSISRILKTLSEKGFVASVFNKDGRMRSVQLTPEGKKIYAEMAEKSEAVYEAIEDNFPAEKMELLLDLLSQLRDVADAVSADALPAINKKR